MKIGLMICGSLDTISGGYLYDRTLVTYLRSHGDTVDIISMPWRKYFSALAYNLSFTLPADLDVLIQDELVHPAVLAANRQSHSYPIISLIHNLHSSEVRPPWQNRLYRRVEKQYLESVDGFVFNSETTRATVRLLVPEDMPQIVAVPGGDRLGSVNAAFVQGRAAEPGPLRVLFLANVTPLKGLHVLFDALGLQSSSLKLDVVGSLTVNRRYARQMQRRSHSVGNKSEILFHDTMNGEALSNKLRQAQVLVIPSYYEGFGIAYLEGMAFGLPAIGTTAGAVPSLVTHQQTGFLIPPGDAAALARHLNNLACDRELLSRLSLNALTAFHAHPTWKQATESIRTFLLQILHEKTLAPM